MAVTFDIGGGYTTQIDDCDVGKVIGKRVGVVRCHNLCYARISVRDKGGKLKRMPLHKYIMNPPRGYEVDHIDGNGLNNKRENLRICTHAENLQNSKDRCHGKQKYRGVRLVPSGNYVAKFFHNGKNIHVGTFCTEEEAAIAWNAKAKELYGKYARLNELPKGENDE